MIDNIKLRVNNKLQFEHNLTKNEIVDLKTSINYFTGELYDYPKKGRLENLEISITEQSAYLKGSLHKYFNNSLYNEDHNYNDFYQTERIHSSQERSSISRSRHR